MNPHTDLDSFAEIVDLPDDSDLVNPAAATINVPADGLLNRTFWIFNRLSAIPALNWQKSTTPGDDLNAAWFNAFEGKWYGSNSGAADAIYFSFNIGESWALDSGPVGALAIRDGYADPDGNMVLVSLGSVQIYDYDAGAVTFTARNALTGTPSGATPMYSIPDDLWCVVYRNAASGVLARTSPDRTNWTTRTMPAAFSGYAGSENPQAGIDANGNIVAVLNTGTGTDYKVAHSDDGGVTWTGTTIATTINSAASRPVYSDIDALWMVIAYDVAGEECEVWTSVLGFGGWTLAYTGPVGAFALHHLAVNGKCWVALGDGGKFYYSIDRGVTWRRSGQSLFAAYADLSLWGGGGGFMALDSSGPLTKASARVGVEGASF